jgi:hypothetical protein
MDAQAIGNSTVKVGTSPLTVTFTNLTTPTLGVSYWRSFGDSAASTEVSPTHTYTAYGTMSVVLPAPGELIRLSVNTRGPTILRTSAATAALYSSTFAMTGIRVMVCSNSYWRRCAW